jgi:serine/threonine protein kinase/tetratricopeptide (TPR) repeat protein
MTPERYERCTDIFLSALECDPRERSAMVRRACAGDASLLAEVESLLAVHFEGGAVLALDRPLVEDGLRVIADIEAPLRVERTSGRYRLLREIGRGGMGVVYEAEDEDHPQAAHVAIKILSPNANVAGVAERFQREREILAALEHPNVARFLGFGMTPDRRPFVVMERVVGEPIDRHCNRRRLSVSERLNLFCQVCAAVQYAHRNLVVHRDLKPSNILVTADGAPKLLDFGIAKIIRSAERPDPTLTATGLRPLTPAYASPEQVRGERVTTLSDVYSLGMLLYVILTGRHPFRAGDASVDEMLEATCAVEPPPPSSLVGPAPPGRRDIASDADAGEAAFACEDGPERLRRRLAGDVDTIVLTALRKEPERRYGSAEELAADIRRHLAGSPILARPSTLGYRLGKFLRRNWRTTALGMALALTVTGGATTIWQFQRAERAQAQAQASVAALRETTSGLREAHQETLKVGGASMTFLRDRVSRHVEAIERALKRAPQDVDMRRELAMALRLLADVQGRPFVQNTGEFDVALRNYRDSLNLCESVREARPDDAQAIRDVSDAYERLGGWHKYRGERESAARCLQKAIAFSDSLAARDAENVAHWQQAYAPRKVRVGLTRASADWNATFEDLRKLNALVEEIARRRNDARARLNRVAVDYETGISLYEMGESLREKAGDSERVRGIFTEALAWQRRSLAAMREIVAERPDDWEGQLRLADALAWVGKVAAAARRIDEASRAYAEAQEIYEKSARPETADASGKFLYWIVQYESVRTLPAGRGADVARAYEKALADYRAKFGASTDAFHVQYFAQCRTESAAAAEADGRFADAIAGYADALDAYERLSEVEFNATTCRRLIAAAMRKAALLARLGREAEARADVMRVATHGKARAARGTLSPYELCEYAWLFVACPVPDVREPEYAQTLMERVMGESGRDNPVTDYVHARTVGASDGARAPRSGRSVETAVGNFFGRHVEGVLKEFSCQVKKHL